MRISSVLPIRIARRRNRLVVCLLHWVAALLHLPWRVRPRPVPAFDDCHEVLLLRTDVIGDAIMTVGFFRAFASAFPEKRLHLLCSSHVEGLRAVLDPYFASVTFTDVPWHDGCRSWRSMWRLASELRGRYDCLVDVRGDFRAVWLMYLSGVRKRIGFDFSGFGFLLTDRVPYDRRAHVVDITYGILDYLGVSDYERNTVLSMPSHLAHDYEGVLPSPGGLTVVICPAGRWPGKLWGTQRFAHVGDELTRRHGATVILLGGPDDVHTCEEVRRAMDCSATNLAGKLPLIGAMECLRRSALAITVDSAPAHLAAAVGTPIVAVYGPASVKQYGPYGNHVVALSQGHRFACSPCAQTTCSRIGDSCMDAVSVASVLDAADISLQRAHDA